MFLADLFNCDVSRLPSEFMLHTFWTLFRHEMMSTANYSDCLVEVDEHMPKPSCYEYLRGNLCSPEFGRKGSTSDERCYRFLHPEPGNFEWDLALSNKVITYNNCTSERRRQVDDKCLPLFRNTCTSRSIRVVKVVRATMESMRWLLRLLPETHVIHLVRDPRAVSLSRYEFHPSGRGLYTRATEIRTEQITREASIYCRQVVADVRWRRILEQEFPGKFYSLTYEQLVIDPLKQASNIYRFIGEADAPPKTVGLFAVLADEGNRNLTAKSLASRWRKNLTLVEQRNINENCAEFISLFPEYVE